MVIFPQIGKPILKYLDEESTANQNLTQNLSGLLVIYWINGYLALIRKNCSSTVRSKFGIEFDLQFSMNLFQTVEKRANLLEVNLSDLVDLI